MAKILNFIMFICEGVIRMFEVIERMAGGEPAEVDPSVTADAGTEMDLAAIVQRIERLEQTVANLVAAPTDEKIPDENVEEIPEEKNESEENEK